MHANVEDLERVLGRPASRVVLTGGAAEHIAEVCAAVLGRPLHVCVGGDSTAGWSLVTGEPLRSALTRVIEAGDPAPYADAYARYLRAHAALREHLAEEDLSR
ncbi:MAG: hypothetical protein ACRDYA_13565 [Egibacteraceae bacterium]